MFFLDWVPESPAFHVNRPYEFKETVLTYHQSLACLHIFTVTCRHAGFRNSFSGTATVSLVIS